jgi:hypothetical protein
MKSKFVVIALGAMLTVGTAAAARTQDRIPELQRDAPKEPATETLTGCVARSSAAGTYMLTNFTKDSKDRKTTATEMTEHAAVTLSGSDVDVSKHVGHRVSVTGQYATASLVAPIQDRERKPPAVLASQADNRPPRTFRITSLTMVSAACSQPTD